MPKTRGTLIAHLQGRENCWRLSAVTPRQAEWIVLVCQHSGLFTRDQVEAFLGQSSQPTASRFVQWLLDARLSGNPIARDLNILVRSGCMSTTQIPDSVRR